MVEAGSFQTVDQGTIDAAIEGIGDDPPKLLKCRLIPKGECPSILRNYPVRRCGECDYAIADHTELRATLNEREGITVYQSRPDSFTISTEAVLDGKGPDGRDLHVVVLRHCGEFNEGRGILISAKK